MFSESYKKATQFTKPLVISVRYFDGSVESSCAAYIVLNKEGWVLTAAHALESYLIYKEQSKKMEEYESAVTEIRSDASLNDKQKRKKISKLSPDKNWVTHHSFWWGNIASGFEEIKFHETADLALIKLSGFAPEEGTSYPKFNNSELQAPGTSLCKLGFPFHYIPTEFKDGKFVLQEGAIPIPFFPLDGILTRIVIGREEGQLPQFIETSTPGLRGQSGGPVFDREGIVWGMQSLTQHFPLGFSPNIRGTVEHQFLNVGWAVHSKQIIKFLGDNNVDVDVA